MTEAASKSKGARRAGCPARATHHMHTGFTLVELLVAMVLGIILLWAATTMYANLKKSTRAMEANSRMLENGRAATELMNRSIRMARYFGCAGVEAVAVTNHFDTSLTDPNPLSQAYNLQGLFGQDGVTFDGITADTITVYQALDETESLLQALVNLQDDRATGLQVASSAAFAQGDTVSITDCSQADVLSVSSISGNFLKFEGCSDCGDKDYGTGAPVLKVARRQYFLAQGDSGEPSLFRKDPNDPWSDRLELVEGVEDMVITYGLRTVGADPDDPNDVTVEFVNATDVTQRCSDDGNKLCWRDITSVRVALLLRSPEDNVATRKQTYRFNGADNTATDKRLRREFISVNALRNYRP